MKDTLKSLKKEAPCNQIVIFVCYLLFRRYPNEKN